MLDITLKHYALKQIKATSADKGAVRNCDLLDDIVDNIE